MSRDNMINIVPYSRPMRVVLREPREDEDESDEWTCGEGYVKTYEIHARGPTVRGTRRFMVFYNAFGWKEWFMPVSDNQVTTKLGHTLLFDKPPRMKFEDDRDEDENYFALVFQNSVDASSVADWLRNRGVQEALEGISEFVDVGRAYIHTHSRAPQLSPDERRLETLTRDCIELMFRRSVDPHPEPQQS